MYNFFFFLKLGWSWGHPAHVPLPVGWYHVSSLTLFHKTCIRRGKLKEIDNGTRKTKLYSIKEILLLVKDCGGLDLSLDLDQTSPLN